MSRKSSAVPLPLPLEQRNGKYHHFDEDKPWQILRDEYVQEKIDNEIKEVFSNIKPKTDGQAEYLDTIEQSIVTLCSGDAGTGKSFLAVYKGLQYLLNKKVDKLCLIRPAIEAGRGIGFLPGNIDEKYRPYLTPFYQNIQKIVGEKKFEELLKDKKIEFLMLEYCRGITLDNAFVIVDEAQNCDINQLRMILTRIGQNCFMVLNGDISQCDLEYKKADAFKDVMRIFEHRPLDGVNTVRLGPEDVVRSNIIKGIVSRIGGGE